MTVTAHVGASVMIRAVSPAAAAVGVHPGMTQSEAKALLPSLLSATPEEGEEEAELHRLGCLALGFAPRVMLISPQMLVLDLSGCERLYASDEVPATRLISMLRKQGYTAQIGVADNPTAASALALAAGPRPRIAPVGDTRKALARVPLECLRLSTAAVETMAALGITNAGEVMAIPREAVASRFGPDLALRLRQLDGHTIEPMEECKIPETIIERLVLPEPTDRGEAVEFCLRRIAVALSARLLPMGRGAQRMEIILGTGRTSTRRESLDATRPVADARSITALLLGRFERMETGAWIESVAVAVTEMEPLPERQQDMFGSAAATHDPGFAGLVDELTGRLGPESVSRIELLPDPRPDRSFRYLPFAATLTPSKTAARTATLAGTPTANYDRARDIALWGRIVTDPAGQPVAWETARGTLPLRVIGGKERVEYGWWEGDRARDYWEVETPDGERYVLALTPNQHAHQTRQS